LTCIVLTNIHSPHFQHKSQTMQSSCLCCSWTLRCFIESSTKISLW